MSFAHASVMLTNLVVFNGTNGANPSAALVQGTDGNFYGTTYNGGMTNGGYGTVFRMTPAGAFTTLVVFSNFNGANPSAALVQATNGNFYGTTYNGGTNGGYGTVFRMTPGGVLTSLVSFNNTNGANPSAALVQGGNGNLYGTTYNGGTNGGYGTVFEVSLEGHLTSLVSFKSTNGAYPAGALTADGHGNFYSTTSAGGVNEMGTVFRMNGAGAWTNLLSFNGSNGAFPSAGLTLGTDGNFYGSTVGGGADASINGTFFRMTSTGDLTMLISLGNTNGATPYDAPIVGLDGNYYGTTTAGGVSNNNFGTIFEMTASGRLANLFSFSDAFPYAALVLGNDGNYYGTTYGGAGSPSGAIYRITIPPAPVIQSCVWLGNTMTITWSAVLGQKYQAQYSSTITPTSWHNLGSVITATSVLATAVDSGATDPERIYRVALLP